MTETVTVSLDRIRLNTYNPNSMDADTFNALFKDMEEGGPEAIDPILIRPLEETCADTEPAYEVVDGEHRTRAALLLGWTEIGARVREMGLEEAMVVNYRKNRERGRLDPVKEGRLYKWWQDKGLNVREIGKKFDASKSRVAQRIRDIEVVRVEAIDALRGKKVKNSMGSKEHSTEAVVQTSGQQTQLTLKEGPLESEKLVLLSSINIKKLLKRSRFLQGLKEHIPEDVKLMKELREKYGETVRSLQVEVAEEIREKSFREAEAYVEKRWAELVVEASRERSVRERRALKAKLEKNGKIDTVILQEEKNWTHRDRLTDKGKVLDKCLYHCPQPAVIITGNMQTEPICAYGACWAKTKGELEAETRRKAEEANRRLTEAREKIIKAGEAGDPHHPAVEPAPTPEPPFCLVVFDEA